MKLKLIIMLSILALLVSPAWGKGPGPGPAPSAPAAATVSGDGGPNSGGADITDTMLSGDRYLVSEAAAKHAAYDKTRAAIDGCSTPFISTQVLPNGSFAYGGLEFAFPEFARCMTAAGYHFTGWNPGVRTYNDFGRKEQ